MKLFIALSLTVAIVSYNSSAQKYSLPEKPALFGTPYSRPSPQIPLYGGAAPQPPPYGGAAPQPPHFGGIGLQLLHYGEYSPQSPQYGVPRRQIPYPMPIYDAAWWKNRYSSSSSEGRHGCRWDDDSSSDDSRPKRSKKCSRCSSLRRTYLGFTPFIRYNTLSNGCIEAILSCPQSKAYALVTFVQTSNFRNTTLAYGVGTQVVAQCGRDGKWHANSLAEDYVTVRGLVCAQLTRQELDKLLYPSGQEPISDINIKTPDDTGDYDDGSAEPLKEVLPS